LAFKALCSYVASSYKKHVKKKLLTFSILNLGRGRLVKAMTSLRYGIPTYYLPKHALMKLLLARKELDELNPYICCFLEDTILKMRVRVPSNL